MAGSSLFALIDDIATILDDVSILTKVAAKRRRACLERPGLNAQQVTGVSADRELPVVLGGGRRVADQQGHPGACGTGHQRAGALAGAAPDGGRRVPLLRGLREAGAQVPAQRGGGPGAPRPLREALANPNVDLVAMEKDKIRARCAPTSSLAKSSPSPWAPWRRRRSPRASPVLAGIALV